ncbi:hypothetical protein [Luethyella okanaganae]|uniref:Uncharacterized protein n=1 Tax=Luethyella okanaganae TaxID=69372 RepID=A0ABW1VAZ6_9MICO
MTDKPYKGTGYWATQIGVSALIAALSLGGGVFVLAGDTEKKGEGVMMMLVGIAFLLTVIWLVKRVMSSTKEQRAVYAWAIMQHHSRNVYDGRPIDVPGSAANDIETMSIAAKARDGRLSLAEVQRLQALRPEVPYPGRLPDPAQAGTLSRRELD